MTIKELHRFEEFFSEPMYFFLRWRRGEWRWYFVARESDMLRIVQ